MTDIFASYEQGLTVLVRRLNPDHPRYAEALTLQNRLLENIHQTLRHGDTETRRADRAQIVEQLNDLALTTLGTSFNELCVNQDVPSSSESAGVRGLLEAMGYRIVDSRGLGKDLYFLCDVRWGAEICQEVVHFVGGESRPGDIAALNDAVTSHDAIRGILLTQNPLPPTLRELVERRRHIRCYTLNEFTDRLANFRPYLEQLIQEYEASEIPAFIVPLAAESEASEDRERQVFKPLELFVDAWLTDPERNHLSILGDFGSGKTWFCQQYAYLAARRYLADPAHNRIPILITLRDYSRAYDVEQLITDAVANRYKVSLTAGYKTFARLNEAGRLLLIFDGFDEMERRVSDHRTTVENFWELARIVCPASKVLLTCRTAYFRHQREEEETLTRRRHTVSLAAGNQVIDLSGQEQFEVIHLLDFDEEAIRLALQKRLPAGWEPVYTKTQELANLRDLASRPVLLDMIVRTLPEIQDAREINQSTLYEAYVNQLLQRRWAEDADYIRPEDRLLFMQELAWEMFQTQRLSISFSEFPERVTQHFNLKDDPGRAAFFERDVRTQSYLARDEAGNYSFAHKSFMEYFVARKMADVISGSDPNIDKAMDIWKAQPLTPEVRDFLAGMMADTKPLWHLIEMTRGKVVHEVGYIGGNTTRVLSTKGNRYVYAGFDFSNTVLTEADFAGKVLGRANFQNAMLAGAEMTGADLSGANLQGANLKGARFTFAHLVNADMRFADLHDVNLREFDQVRDIAFGPDGKTIAVAAANQVRLIDLATGEILGSAMYPSYFRCVAFHPMGRELVAGTADGLVKVWSIKPFAEKSSVFRVSSVYSLSFSPNGERLLVGADDGECVELSWSDLDVRIVPRSTITGSVRASLYSSDGKYMLIAGQTSPSIDVLDANTGHKSTTIRVESDSVMSLALTTDDSRLACGDSTGGIHVLDFPTGSLVMQWLVEEGINRKRWIWDVRFTKDGNLLVSDGPNCTVAVWDAHAGEAVAFLSGHSHRIGAVVLSPDDKLIASGGIDGTVRLWDAENSSELRVFEQKMDCRGLRIRGIQTNIEDLGKFLVERGAIEG